MKKISKLALKNLKIIGFKFWFKKNYKKNHSSQDHACKNANTNMHNSNKKACQ